MDPALASLAGAAGAALVQAMTRDSWDAAKARFSKIFKRHSEDGEPDLALELDMTEHRLRLPADALEPAVAEERQRWAALLAAFLAQHGDAAPELQDFVQDVRQLAVRDSGNVVQQISAGRDSYTAGRDQHVFPRMGDDES
ncbi:MAG: hypothetical protein JWQ95_6643 [Sphaerisporangium sp.]|jgi:hypothetical protein|nr:hypothetical protein [Sphaerisporangium sp.]